MKKSLLILLSLFFVVLFTGSIEAQSVFNEDYNAMPTGGLIGGQTGWYDGGAGPAITAGNGVNGSVGLGTAGNTFTWTAHTFNWNDAALQKVIFGMDFQASGAATFDDDRLGWTTSNANAGSQLQFGVQLDNTDGGIVTFWRLSDGSTRIQTPIVPLSGITANSWYRFRATITKLTSTSAQIDVSLQLLDGSGNPTGTPITGTVPNTSSWAAGAPGTGYFTPTSMWPVYKNYNAVTGAADNAYFEIVTGAAAPAINTSGTLSAFSTQPGVPSTAQTYSVSGSNLTADISITAPSGFELSTNGTTYSSGLTLPQSGGVVSLTTVYVRLNNALEGNFSGNITHASSGATTQNVAVSGTVSNTLSATFQYGASGYTGSKDTFIRDLVANSSTNYSTQTTVEWDDNTDGTADEITMIRFNGLFASEGGPIPDGSIISSATLTYRISAAANSQGSNANVYESLVDWPSTTVTWDNFGGDAGVQADEYNPALIASAPATAADTKYTIDVTASLQRWSNGTANFGWLFLSSSSDGVNVYSNEYATLADRPSLTVVYEPVTGPYVGTAGTLNAFASVPGVPSTAQTYTVSGINLTDNISITAPTGFELSTNGTTYTSGLTLIQSGGTVSSTTVYVRLNSATEGSFSGNITHTSSGATTKNVAVSGDALYINALRLGSGNAYVTFGDVASLRLTQFTLETWFRKEGAGVQVSTGSGGVTTAIPLITKGSSGNDALGQNVNYFFGFDGPTGHLVADFEDNVNGGNHPITGAAVIANNTWYHAAVTFDGTEWRLYLNGVLDGNLAVSATPDAPSTHPFALGTSIFGSTVQGYFNGTMDEVRVWNYARTQTEILATINQEVTSATGLVGRWALNEGTGSVVHNTAGTTIDGTITGTGWSWTSGAPMTINQPPAQPTLVGPSNGSTGNGTSPALTVTVSDPEDDAMTVKFYGRPKQASPGPDFTIIALPDAQNYTTSDPVVAKFTAQTNWIVAQKQLRNIVYVAMEGDITNDNVDASWQRANTAMSILESPSPGIPYAIAIGNHDQIGSTTTLYNNYFGSTRFNGRSYYGGHYGSDNNNNYVLFSASGMDFIAIHFGSGDQAPTTAVLDWADALLKANPTRRAIVVSHSILTSGGTFAAPGTAIYNALSDNPNLFLMLCGHTCYQAQKTDTRTGMGPVYSILSDYQDDAGTGGNGWLRIFTFSPATNKINVASYSPYASLSNYGGVNPFNLDYTMDASQPFTLLGTNAGVASGSTTNFTWPSLGNSTEYEWYVTVSDGNSTITSPTWSFTTEAVASGETVTATLPNTPYAFSTMGATVNFSTLPSGGGDVTITRHTGAPAGTPPGGASFLPVWFEITSTLPANSFAATITVDVNGIAGFDALSNVLYYGTASGQWIPVGGTYNGTAHTFTFTTNHFTDFGFAGATAGAFDLYLGASQGVDTSTVFRPNAAWDGDYPARANDWGFTGTQREEIYVVPEAGAQFGTCNLTVDWDDNVLRYISTDFTGSVFGSVTPTVDTVGLRGGVHITASLAGNTTISPGQFVAKIVLEVIKPGSSGLTVTGCSFQSLPAASSIFVTAHDALHGAYLADVCGADETSGDGKVDFEDLTTWSYAYWSGVPGYAGDMVNYKKKFDIGPTQDGYLFTRPVPDGKIDFEDLLIFAMSYNVSNRHQIAKPAVEPVEPINVAAGMPSVAAGETVVPIMISGAVADLRGLSLILNGQYGKFLGVEPGSMLKGRTTQPIIMSTQANGRLLVDFALAGLKEQGINESGEVLRLRFEGKAMVGVSSAQARNGLNHSLVVNAQGAGMGVPTAFGLSQNYPNPFNPTTAISYQLPAVSQVRISIFDIVGREVATLVNGVQEAGYYTVQWNGHNDAGVQLSSGIYFYRMQAGQFSELKKMLLIK